MPSALSLATKASDLPGDPSPLRVFWKGLVARKSDDSVDPAM